MPIFARWRPLRTLPPTRGRDPRPGVYELADGDKRVLYVGQSATDVPRRIAQHLARPGPLRERAAYWRMRDSRVPQADEAELLHAHLARFGALPPCNRATPRTRDAVRRWKERSGSGNDPA